MFVCRGRPIAQWNKKCLYKINYGYRSELLILCRTDKEIHIRLAELETFLKEFYSVSRFETALDEFLIAYVIVFFDQNCLFFWLKLFEGPKYLLFDQNIKIDINSIYLSLLGILFSLTKINSQKSRISLKTPRMHSKWFKCILDVLYWFLTFKILFLSRKTKLQACIIVYRILSMSKFWSMYMRDLVHENVQ